MRTERPAVQRVTRHTAQQIREWRLQISMTPAESYMQQLLLKLKQLHEENHHVVVSSSSRRRSSTLSVEAWPSDADIKRALQQQQPARTTGKPSTTGTVQKLQQQQQEEQDKRQREEPKKEQGQQKEQPPSQKQKQLREAREWLAQQQASQHSSQAPATPVCVAGTFCTRWEVILSPPLFCLCPLIPLQQARVPCAAGSFCPYFRRVGATDGPGVAPLPQHAQHAKISFNSLSWCQFVEDKQQQAGASLNRSQKKYTCSVCKASFKAHQYAQHVSVGCCHTRVWVAPAATW